MKFELSILAVLALATTPAFAGRLGGLRRKTQAKSIRHTPRRLEGALEIPVQTFFVPLPEQDLMDETFKRINSNANGNVNSLISVAVSTDGTIVWYDHWEDGFEDDVTSPQASSTEIWGDGDASNGCAPSVSSCTDANDVLNAGDALVIENDVSLPRSPSSIKHDGGDRIQASFPIAVTRGAYPDFPGSLLAGAVEVLDTSMWGTAFEAPVGTDTPSSKGAFQLVQLYCMASQAGTTVTTPSGTETLGVGESITVSVKEGEQVFSNKPIQVDLIAGELDSNYQLRWYSLRATIDWSNAYLAPMGDTRGETRVVLHNPNSSSLTITVQSRDGNSLTTYTTQVAAGKSVFSDIIPTGTGAKFTASSNFIGISVTDTQGNGQIYDWGYPIVPLDQLTPEVLVGWGYGCTELDCSDSVNAGEARSVVYVSPTDEADIYVDYDNDGTVDRIIENCKSLSSNIIVDESDKDLSGARIWATEPNSGETGGAVAIAAAWGQNPDRSGSSDDSALDLGTTVLPFTAFSATKIATLIDLDGDGVVSPGDKLKYTIQVANVGQADVAIGGVTITDTLDPQVSYVPNTLVYSSPDGQKTVADDNSGTAFPLDGSGIVNQYMFTKRGGTHEITFEVLINSAVDLTKKDIINTGIVTFGNTDIPFKVVTPLVFTASVEIQKTVYQGHDNKVSCNGGELVTGPQGELVTYCFDVTNTGNTYLDTVKVDDVTLSFTKLKSGLLAPGQKTTMAMEDSIQSDLEGDARVTGEPVFQNGDTIPGLTTVTDEDPAGVKVTEVSYAANVDIQKTVYLGHDNKSSCNGDELVQGPQGEFVTYCFKVTNTGNTHLEDVRVQDQTLSFNRLTTGILAPGQTILMALEETIETDLEGDAVVTGNPCDENGQPVPVGPVTDQDPAGVLVTEDGGTSPRLTDDDEEEFLCE